MTPSAAGSLADTPLAHGLVYARNRRLTGFLEVMADPERRGTISLLHGRVVRVETTPVGLCPGGYLGAILYEQGLIDSSILDATLLEIAQTKRLHGEVLIARGAITTAQRDEALVEQIHRKIHHLFSFPETSTYGFYDTRPKVDSPVAVDPVGPVWRGIREYPPTRFVHETMRRVGDNVLRALAGGGAHLPPAETALLQAIAQHPMTVAEMKAKSTELTPARVELLTYLLVISKCVEAVTGVRTHPSTGALPATMPSGPVRGLSGEVRRLTPPEPRRISSTKIAAQQGGSPAPPPAGSLAALRTPAELGLDGIRERATNIDSETYWDVLGVADGASPEAVRAAYMRLAKTWHPDRLVADFNPVRTEVATVFNHMTKAHTTLCDPDARRAYVAQQQTKRIVRPRTIVMREISHAMEHRHFDAAIERCEELLEHDKDDAEAIAIMAWASVSAGEATEDALRGALVKIEKAVNVDRTNDAAIYHRGLVNKRLGNGPIAIRDFARAIQLNPKNLPAEREVRIFAMRVKKGSGEHKLIAPILDKLKEK